MISSRAGPAWSTIGPVSTQQAPTRQHMTCSSIQTPSPPPPCSPKPPPTAPPFQQESTQGQGQPFTARLQGVITGKHSSHTQNAHTTPPLPAYIPGLHPLPHTHTHTPTTSPPPPFTSRHPAAPFLGHKPGSD